MDRNDAIRILEPWLNCPVAFGGDCPKDDSEEECIGFCWRKEEIKEAVRSLCEED